LKPDYGSFLIFLPLPPKEETRIGDGVVRVLLSFFDVTYLVESALQRSQVRRMLRQIEVETLLPSFIVGQQFLILSVVQRGVRVYSRLG